MATSVGQFFEVYASKTEADAKALASSNPGAMCFTTDTHRIVFNGVVYNLVEIINNLTDGSTNKALSAAQGKALKGLIDALPTVDEMNTAINGKLGSVYRVMGTKANISEVLALTNAVKGDTWNVTAEFKLGGKKYPAGTNVVCVTNTSSSDHNDDNWDALGGTVDLSVFLKAADAANTYLKKTDASNTYATKAGLEETNEAISGIQGTLNEHGKKMQGYDNHVKAAPTNFYVNLPLVKDTVNSSDNAKITSILGKPSAIKAAIKAQNMVYGKVSNASGSDEHGLVSVSAMINAHNCVILDYVIVGDANDNGNWVVELNCNWKDDSTWASMTAGVYKISEIKSTADTAKSTADTAKSTANTAKTNADKAVAALTIK